MFLDDENKMGYRAHQALPNATLSLIEAIKDQANYKINYTLSGGDTRKITPGNIGVIKLNETNQLVVVGGKDGVSITAGKGDEWCEVNLTLNSDHINVDDTLHIIRIASDKIGKAMEDGEPIFLRPGSNRRYVYNGKNFTFLGTVNDKERVIQNGSLIRINVPADHYALVIEDGEYKFGKPLTVYSRNSKAFIFKGFMSLQKQKLTVNKDAPIEIQSKDGSILKVAFDINYQVRRDKILQLKEEIFVNYKNDGDEKISEAIRTVVSDCLQKWFLELGNKHDFGTVAQDKNKTFQEFLSEQMKAECVGVFEHFCDQKGIEIDIDSIVFKKVEFRNPGAEEEKRKQEAARNEPSVKKLEEARIEKQAIEMKDQAQQAAHDAQLKRRQELIDQAKQAREAVKTEYLSFVKLMLNDPEIPKTPEMVDVLLKHYPTYINTQKSFAGSGSGLFDQQSIGTAALPQAENKQEAKKEFGPKDM